MGLALVRHFVELHAGSVEARSEGLGKGATFLVRLPLAPVRPSASKVDPVPPLRAKLPGVKLPSLAGIRVLVVDDESDGREAVALVLEHCGASVKTAGSVAEAMSAFSSAVFDAVVSDIAMPSEDGFALIARLRAHGDTPALALTGYVGQEDRQRILAAGYQTCLTKPVAAAELGETIARLVQS